MMKILLSGLALFMLTSTTSVQAQSAKVIESFGNVSATTNGEVKIPVVLKNVNAEDIKNLSLTINVNGEKQQVLVSPDVIKTGNDGVSFYVTANAPSTTGLSDVTVTLDAINGVKVNENENITRGNLMTVSRNVDHKVVIEEFTAIWCPTCPTGLVGIERTKLNYGDKVIIIAAHDQDPMTCKDYNVLTSKNTSLPRAMVDRDPTIDKVNPYIGSQRSVNEAGYGLGYDVEEQMAIAPVAEVKVSGFSEDNNITVKADVTMLYSGAANYGIAYVITQDGLSHESWKQINSLPMYYRDHPVIELEPLWEKWFNGDTEVTGVVYDDVARMGRSVLSGKPGLIPETVKEEETYSHEEVFDLKKYSKIKNTDNMNLIAFVVDRNTGKIINADKIKLSDANAIEGVEADSENVVEVARYTIDGQRIATPQKGINIVKYSDGSAKKIVIK